MHYRRKASKKNALSKTNRLAHRVSRASLVSSGFSYQSLEARQLLAADFLDAQPLEADPVTSADHGTFDVEQDSTLSLSLPIGLPERFAVEIEHAGEALTLQLEKRSVFGDNTRFLLDDGSGELVQIPHNHLENYIGAVAEQPGSIVSAVLTGEGLVANIVRPNEPAIEIVPVGNGLHTVGLVDAASDSHNHDHDGDGVPDHAAADHPEGDNASNNNGDDCDPGCNCPACVGAATGTEEIARSTSPIVTSAVSENPPVAALTSGATLPPTRVLDVREFEVGIEIGSAAFLNNYGGDLNLAQSVAAGIGANLDIRFLHATGIKHRVGTVIIRQSAAEDKFNVANGNDSAGLSNFRNYWNNNPGEVGNTHDVAVYHVRANPSGLAWVNSIGTGNRYALSASNGPTSWANGTATHEVGHSWGLLHTGDSGFFYESRPRSNGNAAGGNDDPFSIMGRSINRLASDEASRVYNVRQGKLGFGDLISNPGPVKPFGHRDAATTNGAPITIDVIANDYDVNNDVLNVQLRDTISQQGGTISLSEGTGPGGRNEILYTPPSGVNGSDFFHYTVVDSSGLTDWGAVYVENVGPVVVDLTLGQYDYHVGPADFRINEGWGNIFAGTTGDIKWSGVVGEGGEMVGPTNRGYVFASGPITLSHKLSPGTWNVAINMGSEGIARDNMTVTAEGVEIFGDVDTAAGAYPTMSFQVDVTDGELNLEFDDLGGADPDWVLNRLSLTRVGGPPPTVVDTSLESYNYHVGPDDLPLNSGWGNINSTTNGDIDWSGGSLDEGGAFIGGFNRGYVLSDGPRTLTHKLANGIWRVTMNFGSENLIHDNMSIMAEGQLIDGDLDSPAASYTGLGFDVEVIDGELTLQFDDLGGNDPNWALNRLSLNRIGDVTAQAPVVTSSMRDGGSLDGSGLNRPDQLGTLSITFDQDVMVASGDLFLVNETENGSVTNTSGVTFSYDDVNYVATWDFTTSSVPIEPAFYEYALLPSVKSVETGLALDGNNTNGIHTEPLHVALPGDMDLDGSVDVLTDGFALVQNLGIISGASWNQGDLNGDGKVDVLGDGFAFVQSLGQDVRPPAAIAFATAATTLGPVQTSVVSASSVTPVLVAEAIDEFFENDESSVAQSAVVPTGPLVLMGAHELTDDAFADQW